MLTVTENALEHLSGVLDEREAPDDMAVRCVVQSGQLALVPDSKKENDIAYQHGERTVLLVQKELCDALDGRALDVDPSDGDPQLTIGPADGDGVQN